jgi:hypothetical protein
MHLNQPVRTQHSTEIHAKELERKAETSKLEKLKARLDVKVRDQRKSLILARAS